MDYSKVTMMEYQEKKRKIFESLGAIKGDCKGTSLICDDCPFFIKTYTSKCGASPYNEQYHTKEAVKLVMDYEIPVDWSKVDIDTHILVSDDNKEWHKRYFYRYENGKVNAFKNGRTSWSRSPDCCYYTDTKAWKYAKLANTESEEQK